MSGGTRLVRPSVIGTQDVWNNCPTYREVVRTLVRKFRISNPIRTIVNLYRDGKDSTSAHKDQYFAGDTGGAKTNFTCGVSVFGVEKEDYFCASVISAFSVSMSEELLSFVTRRGYCRSLQRRVGSFQGLPTHTPHSFGDCRRKASFVCVQQSVARVRFSCGPVNINLSLLRSSCTQNSETSVR